MWRPAGATGHQPPVVLQGLGIDRVIQRRLCQCHLTHRAGFPGNTAEHTSGGADLGTDLVHGGLSPARGH